MSKKVKLEIDDVSKEERVKKPTFSTQEPQSKDKKDGSRGPNFTPKSDFRVGRNWSYANWLQAFDSHSKRWERENFKRRRDATSGSV